MSAAQLALESNNIKLILPWVSKDAEEELSSAFKKTVEKAINWFRENGYIKEGI